MTYKKIINLLLTAIIIVSLVGCSFQNNSSASARPGAIQPQIDKLKQENDNLKKELADKEAQVTETTVSTEATTVAIADAAADTTAAPEEKIYKLNEVYTFSNDEGSYSVEITGAKEIPLSDMNISGLGNAKQAILFEMVYKNISRDKDIFLAGILNFTIFDADGLAGNQGCLLDTPAMAKHGYNFSKHLPKNMTCKANFECQFDEPTKKVKLFFYNGSFDRKNDAVFEVDVS